MGYQVQPQNFHALWLWVLQIKTKLIQDDPDSWFPRYNFLFIAFVSSAEVLASVQWHFTGMCISTVNRMKIAVLL